MYIYRELSLVVVVATGVCSIAIVLVQAMVSRHAPHSRWPQFLGVFVAAGSAYVALSVGTVLIGSLSAYPHLRFAEGAYPFEWYNLAGIVAAGALGLILAIELFPQHFGSMNRGTAYSTEAEVQVAVASVLRSDCFLTAINEALPRGEDDAEFGLDYIPYMLKSIDTRRQRAARAAAISLVSTVALGTLFSGVVMYYGYTLVHEPAPGLPRVLADLTAELGSIDDELAILLPGTLENPVFARDCAPDLEYLRTLPAGLNTELAASLRLAIATGMDSGDLPTLADSLKAFQMSVAREGRDPDPFSETLVRAERNLRSFVNGKEGAVARLHNEVLRIEAQRQRAEVASADDKYKLTDLVKRVALGVVVSAFLLAILRWVAGIYRSYHRQALTAEADDMFVRQFYVAYKSSSGDSAARSAVLGAFLSSRLARPAVGNDGFSLSKEESGIVKELLVFLEKRL